MSTTINSGLQLTYPDLDETNWNSLLQAIWLAISAHNHDAASNSGALIGSAALAANGVTDAAIRLRNNQALRARNAADAADVNLLKLDASNVLDILTVLKLSSSETLTASGALSVATTLSILNGASLAMTLAAGAEGQLKIVANNASTTATVTPASTSGANTVSLGQYGCALFVYLNSEWRAFVAPRAAVSDDTEAFSGAGTWSGASAHVRCTGTTYTITTPSGFAGQQVIVENAASGNVTFGGAVMATGTYYLYSYLNSGWRRVALT